MSTEYFCYTIFARCLIARLQNIIDTLRIRCARMFTSANGKCDDKKDNTIDQMFF